MNELQADYDVCKYTAPLAVASESNKMLSVLRPLLHLLHAVQATQNRLFDNANNMSNFTIRFIISFNYTLLRLSKYHYILK